MFLHLIFICVLFLPLLYADTATQTIVHKHTVHSVKKTVHHAGKVHSLKTRAEYFKYFNGTKPLILFYSGKHCGPCKIMHPAYESLAHLHPHIQFCEIDTSNPAFKKNMQDLKIRSVPTLIFSHKGEVLRKEVGGVSRHEMEAWIKDFEKNTLKKEVKKK